MEPNRTQYRIAPRRTQAGITAIGFLVLACLFGVLGLAGLRVVPLYLQKMTLNSVLHDLETNTRGGGQTVQGIRNELEKRLSVESIDVPRESVKITQVASGYQVRIQQEAKAHFVVICGSGRPDEQVEIRR
jgi:hypothetical protein